MSFVLLLRKSFLTSLQKKYKGRISHSVAGNWCRTHCLFKTTYLLIVCLGYFVTFTLHTEANEDIMTQQIVICRHRLYYSVDSSLASTSMASMIKRSE